MRDIIPNSDINVEKPNLISIGYVGQESDLTIPIALYKNNAPFNIQGQTITIGGRLPNGKLIKQNDGYTVQSPNNLTLNLKNEFTSVAGVVEIDLKLTDSNGSMTTASFSFRVMNATLGSENVNATDLIPEIDKVIQDTQKEFDSFKLDLGDVPLQTQEKTLKGAINEIASATYQNTDKLSIIDVKNESESEISLEICDKDSFEWSKKGSMYSLSNGNIVSSEYTKNYAYSKKIEIESNKKYSIGVTSGQALFWNNELSYINNIDLTSTNGSFTTPANAKYIAFNKNEADWIIPMYSLKLLISKDKSVTIPFLTLLDLNIPDRFISKKKLNPEIQNTIDSVKNNFIGKKGVCFGDSNTEFGTYPEQLGELLGCSVLNCGFGGTRYVMHHGVGNFDFFSMCKLTDAVVSNDFSEQENVIANMSGKYAEHFNNLKSINWQEIDFIILNFGTNDYSSYGVKLGEKNSTDKYQINGALNHILTSFMTAFPRISLYLLSPIFRGKQKNEGTSDDNIYGAGENTLWMKDIVEAVRLKAIEYHVPFKDLYNEFGMNKYNFSTFLQSDGVHLNDDVGVPRMANIVANFLKSN